MAPADRERWDQRHGASHHEELQPSAPTSLFELEDLLPKVSSACQRRVLDVACGTGRTAVWFAQRDFSVDAIDVSPVALCVASGFAARLGVSSKVTWREVDLDGGIGTSDTYDVVLCQRFRDPKLYSQLAARTAPGGLLLVTVLSECGHAGPPSKFRAKPGELAESFRAEGLQMIKSMEADGEASILLRRDVPRMSNDDLFPLLYVFGLPGAGKTFLGKVLEREVGYRFLEGDTWLPEDLRASLRRGEGFTPEQRDRFAQVIAERIQEARCQESERATKARPLAVAQATFKRRHRDMIRRFHSDVQFVWVQCEEETRLSRLSLGGNLVDVDLGRRMALDFEPPDADERVISLRNDEGVHWQTLLAEIKATVG